MKEKYLVVIPISKDAYLKKFANKDRAVQLITEKVGTPVPDNCVTEYFETPTFIFSRHEGKSNKSVNERATYIAEMPSEDKNIFGPAVVIGKADGCIDGFTLEKAEKICEEINELRAG